MESGRDGMQQVESTLREKKNRLLSCLKSFCTSDKHNQAINNKNPVNIVFATGVSECVWNQAVIKLL